MPAAAITARSRKLLGSSFAFFSSFAGAALADDADDDIVSRVGNQLDTLRQIELGKVNAVADLQGAEVNFDEARKVSCEAVNVDFSHDVVNEAAVELDARSDFFVDEVQRHLDVDFVRGIDAQLQVIRKADSKILSSQKGSFISKALFPLDIPRRFSSLPLFFASGRFATFFFPVARSPVRRPE